MKLRDAAMVVGALALLWLYSAMQTSDAESAERDRAAQYSRADITQIADQALRHLRAGHRPEHAIRLAMLGTEISKLQRRLKWEI